LKIRVWEEKSIVRSSFSCAHVDLFLKPLPIVPRFVGGFGCALFFLNGGFRFLGTEIQSGLLVAPGFEMSDLVEQVWELWDGCVTC
jgi:hypothetical protein